MDKAPEQIEQIDYQTPVPPSAVSLSAIVAIVFGAGAALLSPLALFIGVEFVIGLLQEWQRWHRVDNHDTTACIMFLAVGFVCAFVAWRWLRGGIRELRQADGR